MRSILRRGHAGEHLLNRWESLALVLFVAIQIPGLFLILGSGPLDEGKLTASIQGGVSSGWIDDVQTFGGNGHDSWPTMVSSGDNIYVAFSRFDSGTGYYNITVMMSADGGVIWSQIGDFSPGSGDCKYPVMTIYGGVLFVAFQYDLSATDHDIYCYKSSAGMTGPWAPLGVRTDTNDDYHPAIAAVTIANHAGVYVVFENKRGITEGTDLLMYKSLGDSFSFVNTVVGGGDLSEYAMADASVYQDANNPIIYVAYQKSTGGQNDIYFVRTLNGGATWSSPYQVTSNSNDEYAPSISVGYFYLLISYVMWNGNPDLYATVWNGVSFGTPYPLSSGTDYEGWPVAFNWMDDFYVFYAKGSTYTNGNLYMRSANGRLDPYWSVPSLVSDSGAAVDAEYRPGLALCDRPDANFYLAATWRDYRAGADNSDIYYSTQGCRYTINANPPGMTFQVDDVTYSSQQTFNWPAGFQHKLTASDVTLPFVCWDDGTYQWYTPTITPYALTNDVDLMMAYYGAIPEFSHLALPAMGTIVILLLSIGRRRHKRSVR